MDNLIIQNCCGTKQYFDVSGVAFINSYQVALLVFFFEFGKKMKTNINKGNIVLNIKQS